MLFYTNVSSNNIEIKYLKGKYNNDNIVSYFYSKYINIPLVKTCDNSYYLNHNLYNQLDDKGTIYLDYRSNSNKTIIYGHSSNIYDIPFNYLNNLDEFYIYDGIEYHYIITNKYVVNNKYDYERVLNSDSNMYIQTCYDKDSYLILTAEIDNK